MAPKAAKSRVTKSDDMKSEPGTTSEPSDSTVTNSTTAGSKRKRPTKPPSDSANSKSARRSARSNPTPSVPPQQVLSYLLSPASAVHCRPAQEHEALEASPTLATYTSTVPLFPFEELLAAVLLSRPISHALGQRSLRHLINSPRGYRTPKAIIDAGEAGIHQALEEARTQHKAKTAEQVSGLAKVVVDEKWGGEGDTDLGGLREKYQGMADGGKEGNSAFVIREALKKELKSKIKGLGDTGTEIFMRRIQGVWGFLAPFIDKRTGGGLEKLGLPGAGEKGSGEELLRLVKEHWGSFGELADIGGVDEEEKQRLAFVRVLDRATGADLEGTVDIVLQAAGKEEQKEEEEES